MLATTKRLHIMNSHVATIKIPHALSACTGAAVIFLTSYLYTVWTRVSCQAVSPMNGLGTILRTTTVALMNCLEYSVRWTARAWFSAKEHNYQLNIVFCMIYSDILPFFLSHNILFFGLLQANNNTTLGYLQMCTSWSYFSKELSVLSNEDVLVKISPFFLRGHYGSPALYHQLSASEGILCNLPLEIPPPIYLTSTICIAVCGGWPSVLWS